MERYKYKLITTKTKPIAKILPNVNPYQPKTTLYNKPILKTNINAINQYSNKQIQHGKTVKLEHEKKLNGYDLYSYGKVPLQKDGCGKVLVDSSNNQSFHQQSNNLNQSFCNNENQSICSCRKQTYDISSKSVCQSIDRSFDLNSSFDSRYEPTPIKKCNPYLNESIRHCRSKYEDVQNDLHALKEDIMNERTDFKLKLKELRRLLTKRISPILTDSETQTDNVEESCESLGKLTLELESVESVCPETIKTVEKLETKVELPEIEFGCSRRKSKEVEGSNLKKPTALENSSNDKLQMITKDDIKETNSAMGVMKAKKKTKRVKACTKSNTYLSILMVLLLLGAIYLTKQ